MRPEHIENLLVTLNSGQWFGWSDSKNKVYENLVINYDDKEKPTKEWLETELTRQQDAWDTEQVVAAKARVSAIEKLKALGLTTEEVQEAFGL